MIYDGMRITIRRSATGRWEVKPRIPWPQPLIFDTWEGAMGFADRISPSPHVRALVRMMTR